MKEYILMADIIDSSSYPGKELIKDFRSVVDHANCQFSNSLKSPLTITLGDEFQGIVCSLKAGINSIIHIEELLISKGYPFQLRYILNQGEVETPINPERAYGMLGEGLTMAREQLVVYKKEGERFHVMVDDDRLMEQLNQALILYQHITDQWHEKDLPVVALFLSGKNYREVAELTDRDESSTWRREKSLGIKAYTTAKKLIVSLAND